MELDLKAAQNGDISYFKEKIADKITWLTSSYPKSGDTVVHIAAKCNHLDLLDFLANEGANLETANLDGKRPLHMAAQYSSTECLNYLLKRGVQVDSLKRADWTPLMLACTKNNLQIIQTLVGSGANPGLRNKDGWNSFHIAVREGHLPIIQYLLSCEEGLWDNVSLNGRTPLHTAALHGHFEVVDWLIDNCSYHSDTPDSCGTTPLMNAFQVESIPSAKLLIAKHRADVRRADNLGREALHVAAQAGAQESIKYLVEYCHLSPDTPSSSSQLTALHCAAKEGHTAVLKLLICIGVDVNATDDKGRTALHIASGAQHAESVGALLQGGAECRPDAAGILPQDLAGKPEVKEAFHSNGIT